MATITHGFIDIEIEIPVDEMVMAKMHGKDVEDEILRRLKDEADRVCERNKCELRTESTPEIVTKRAIVPSTGEEVLLVASRWSVDGPEELFKPRV